MSSAVARFASLLLLFLLGLPGCANVAPVAKIGLVAPFEGRERAVGYDAIYAARLALRASYQADEMPGYRVELVAVDDSADPGLAREAAAGLIADPAVVVVLGHWQTAASAAARPLYQEAGLPLLELGAAPFLRTDAQALPEEFLEAYAGLTPFDERAGPYAAATYDAVGMTLAALAVAKMKGEISRESVAAALETIQYQGLIGELEWSQ